MNKYISWAGKGVLAVMLLATVGCVTQQMEMERSRLLQRGFPPEYADGYGDGYGSGMRAAGNPYAKTVKNIERYLRDEKYKLGWDDGFATGKGSYESTTRALR
jgi:hypothetical protein